MHCQQLNVLSDGDYVRIMASLKYLYEQKFNCNSPDKYSPRTNRRQEFPPELIQRRRLAQGCDVELTNPQQFHRHDSLVFKRCVCNYFDYNINILTRGIEFYKAYGRLPPEYIYARETLPAKAWQALKIVDHYLEELKLKELKKQQAELKTK